MMKNASIKEMIRKQKMDATDRREFVSGISMLGSLTRHFFVCRKYAIRSSSSAIG